MSAQELAQRQHNKLIDSTLMMREDTCRLTVMPDDDYTENN